MNTATVEQFKYNDFVTHFASRRVVAVPLDHSAWPDVPLSFDAGIQLGRFAPGLRLAEDGELMPTEADGCICR